ncbi:RING-H2 finger protein ATL43 [Quercus lobata]|uniref:RING-type E3 ubiquitin transferase n=1 Tax=Quercus lobata TaxID=97700 RepID=A0A7N2MWC0_QUELO|nr:RING-H2 finger protein ATL43 [Quercus lobata]
MECFFFVFKPLTLVALFLILLSAPPSMADDDNNNNNVTGGGVFLRDIATNSSSNSPPPMSSENHGRSVPFRPSMVVIIVVLAGIFSVVFLVLLYAKHCTGDGIVVVTATPARATTARKNSGIDRGVVESLPVFRFGSLRGQKEGLDCAVCLNRFDSNEVLRLLPKCKHAFHVECVDTWLDAHSTCPLCRYRVDPEDILLVDRNPPPESRQNSTHEVVLDVNVNVNVNPIGNKRFSGRHSSGGEKGFLRSNSHDPMALRRSLDSAGVRKKSQSLRAIGSYDYPRKDGLLSTSLDRGNSRVEHRIIVSSNSSRAHDRWSDAQPSDLLYLGSEMIMSDSRRFLSTSRSSQQQHSNGIDGNGNELRRWGGASSGGRKNTDTNTNSNTVMNGRSVSEITGFSRFPIKANRANSTH